MNSAEGVKLTSITDDLYVALKATEFGFNHRRCVVCAGWMCSPNGETDLRHTKDCIIAAALKRYEKAKS